MNLFQSLSWESYWKIEIQPKQNDVLLGVGKLKGAASS